MDKPGIKLVAVGKLTTYKARIREWEDKRAYDPPYVDVLLGDGDYVKLSDILECPDAIGCTECMKEWKQHLKDKIKKSLWENGYFLTYLNSEIKLMKEIEEIIDNMEVADDRV